MSEVVFRRTIQMGDGPVHYVFGHSAGGFQIQEGDAGAVMTQLTREQAMDLALQFRERRARSNGHWDCQDFLHLLGKVHRFDPEWLPTEMPWSRDIIQTLLPQRGSMLLLDRVTSLTVGKEAEGILFSNDRCCEHLGVLPELNQLGALGHLVTVTVLSDPNFSTFRPVLKSCGRIKTPRLVKQGEVLSLSVKLLDPWQDVQGLHIRAHGTASVEGEPSCSVQELEMLFSPAA